MRLTSSSLPGSGSLPSKWWLSPPWAFVVVLAALLGVFALDWVTDAARVEHLYYLPILFAALRFGRRGGLTAALAAVLLYHLANRRLISHLYGPIDVIQIVLFLAVGLFTAQLTREAARFRRLALTDDLTGLHNLRSFEERLTKMLHASRAASTPVAVLVLDMDRLKILNDTYGHLVGAQAVRTVGRIIAAHLPPDAVACRYGGDEFAVAIPECEESQAQEIAGQLCQAVEMTAPPLAGRRLPAGSLSISVGVACSRTSVPGEEAGERLFRAADQALYLAKAAGRNCVRVSEAATASPTALAPAVHSSPRV